MNMDLWVREQIATQDKKAAPLLSYPATQLLFISVEDFSCLQRQPAVSF